MKCIRASGAFVEFPKPEVEQSIPERFEKIVGINPHGIAVKAEDQAVTYAELNAMANRVARKIVQQRGSEAEPIGVLLEKGLEQIVAILGTLKAGKFFALLDPSFPAARNTGMLADLRPGLVITNQDSVSPIGKHQRSQYRFLEIEPYDAETPGTDLELRITPRRACCCLIHLGVNWRTQGCPPEPSQRASQHDAAHQYVWNRCLRQAERPRFRNAKCGDEHISWFAQRRDTGFV